MNDGSSLMLETYPPVHEYLRTSRHTVVERTLGHSCAHGRSQPRARAWNHRVCSLRPSAITVWANSSPQDWTTRYAYSCGLNGPQVHTLCGAPWPTAHVAVGAERSVDAVAHRSIGLMPRCVHSLCASSQVRTECSPSARPSSSMGATDSCAPM